MSIDFEKLKIELSYFTYKNIILRSFHRCWLFIKLVIRHYFFCCKAVWQYAHKPLPPELIGNIVFFAIMLTFIIEIMDLNYQGSLFDNSSSNIVALIATLIALVSLIYNRRSFDKQKNNSTYLR